MASDLMENVVTDKTLLFSACEEATRYIGCTILPAPDCVHLADVTFERCRFDGDYSQGECLDVVWTHCDMANSDWHHGIFSGCTWQDCRLTGSDWSDSRIIQCTIAACTAPLSNWSATRCDQLKIQDSDFQESSWQVVRAQHGLSFPGCQLEGADFTETSLKNWQLNDAIFTNLQLTPTLLSGLKIAAWQAPTLAATLGVKISD